jgi:hypothetical protein
MDVMIVAARGGGVGEGHWHRATALAEALRSGGAAVTLLDGGTRFDPAMLPPRADLCVADVPDAIAAAAALSPGWVRVEESGDVALPDGTRLEGLRYALLRPGFRRLRPQDPVPWNRRVLLHHAARGMPADADVELVQLTDHPRPWEIAATCSRTVSYPSMTALEGACLGHALTLLPPRNAGERTVATRLVDAARRPGTFAAVDGLGAWRVAGALRAYVTRRSSTRK